MIVTSAWDGGETPSYPGHVLLRPFTQRAWTGSTCDAILAVHPDQPTRFFWLEVSPAPMSYEEAQTYFENAAVVAVWDGATSGSVTLSPVQIVPYSTDWQNYVCTFTE